MTDAVRDMTFKKAITTSFIAHLAVFLLLLISPRLPQPSKRGMVHYIPLDMVVAGGGGGRGGTGGLPAGKPAAAPAKKETLRDLTVPQKIQTESQSSLRYPVEKPKKEPKTKTEKKAVLTKPEPSPPEKTQEEGGQSGAAGGEGTGSGTGLRIGGGGGPGGEGFGPGFGPGLGLANFPYTYYLNIITERVSANWFTSLVDPGVAGSYQTIIYFRIQKNGQITNLEVERSSGLTPLDLSALRAVRASAPFPPLPRDYQEAYLAIHLIFEHSR